MTERFSELLRDWVQRGGTLVSIGPFGLSDECGFDLPAEKSLFRLTFPNLRKLAGDEFAYGVDGKQSPPALEVKKCGRGTLAYLNRPLDVARRTPSLWGPLEKLLASAGQRTAVSQADDLKILVRETADGQKYLCLCNRNVEKAVEAAVTVQGRYVQAVDVVVPGWCPVPLETKTDRSIVKVRLDPGDFTMILLSPNKK